MEDLNEKEFEAIVLPLETPIYKHIRWHTRNYKLTNDLVQDVYERAWRWRKNLLQAESPEAYLKAIAIHRVVEHDKKEWRADNIVEKYAAYRLDKEDDLDLDAVLDTVQRKEDKEMLTKAVEDLPQQLRDIIMLRYMVGCTLRQVAIRQQLKYTTTLDKHNKALKLLRKSLEGRGIHISDLTLRSWLFMLYR